jgi:hypothetical protein
MSTYTSFGQPFVPHDCPHHPGVTVDDVFCPVCHALENNFRDGFWGGRSPDERKAIKNDREEEVR